MKIALDPNIPFILNPLSSLPDTEITHDMTADGVRDADALIIRTRTKCDAELLEGSRCKFIGTATIGTDHIDLAYCRDRGITVANAPGCNAPAVAQWVLAAIKNTGGFKGRVLGIIGAGHVGSILIDWAKGLGMKVLVNDPPLQAEQPELHSYSTLDQIAVEADIISVHTPLTRDGLWPTDHLIDNDFISKLKRRPLLLNAARGAVTDTDALLRGLRDGLISDVAIDCWENEPDIKKELLEKALIATPHIAGYSKEGKIRATQMVLDALSKHLGLKHGLCADAPEVRPVPGVISDKDIDYDIFADTRVLKNSPASFETQRNHYDLRHEPGQTDR